jgi:hypothetical protein
MADVLTDPDWRLYARALERLERGGTGLALPMLRRLARRGFAPAMSVLSDFVPNVEALRLLRRAALGGDAIAAYNCAIVHRNRGDLRQYRLALARAARLDPDSAAELRRFKTRFPHTIMRRLRRLEPARNQ